MPDSVTSIGRNVFEHCSSLRSITLPNRLTSLGTYSTFGNCSSLTSVNFPDSLTNMGAYTFSRCTSLSSITIPSNVTNIGNYAFESCTSLTSITLLPPNPPTLGTNVFLNVPNTLKIYVPAASVTAYQGASGWSSYASQIEAIPSN